MAIKEEFLPDGSDWYLSGASFTDIRQNYFEVICSRTEDVPQKEINELKRENNENYMAALSKGGKAWLIEPLHNLQPQSFAVLEEHASDYMVGFHWYGKFGLPVKDTMLTQHFFEVCGRLLSLRAIISTYEEDSLFDKFYCKESLQSLPDVLAKSWLWRTGGWAIHNSIPGSVMNNRQLIGHPSGQWSSIGKLLRSFNPSWEKKYLPVVQEQIPDTVVTHYNPHDGSPSEWHALRCFLDTRPEGLNGPCGDQFLVVDFHTDQTVYHIHDGDVKNIRILQSPSEAIDAYCAHTLLRTPGRFDFMPWSEPLK